ncbi:MAG: ChaN family lipoprotein [Bacteroidota bacterium]
MRKYHLLLTLCFTLFSVLLFGQKKPAYKIYNSKGKKVSYKKMVKRLKKQEIVLFGETHNNPIAHWLQLEVTKDLHQSQPLILGAEMLEADNQIPLTQYLKNEIDYTGLDTLARLWSNYKTDYAPLVDFARENNLPFVATNIPRRYASQVYREGGFEALDDLSQKEKSWIAPLPILFDPNLPQYKNILTMMGDHGTPELVKAQAIKDATMAYFISKNYQKGKLFLHFNGSYHSDYYEGIMWYLRQIDDSVKYGSITTVSQKNVNKLLKEHKGKADFIICVDEDMTTTY